MLYFSNNGNINEINLERQSSPDYILEAIDKGFKVKCSIRLMSDDNFWLGEEEAIHKIEDNFLIDNAKYLLIHCKNISSLYKIHEFEKQHKNLHYYYHSTDNISITSKKYFLLDYGKKPISDNTIVMFPEETNFQKRDLDGCAGIVSNTIDFYKKLLQ